MYKTLIFVIIVLIAATLVIGLLLADANRGETSTVEREMAALRLETARRLQIVTIGFRAGLAAVILLTLGGIAFGTVRFILRRTDTVYPNKAGLYPIREGRIGRIRFFHDPNRAPMPTALYGPQGVSHLTASGFEASTTDHRPGAGSAGSARSIVGQRY